MKEFKIEVPEGYEVDQENSTFERIVFKEKDKLPSKWSDVKSGFWNWHTILVTEDYIKAFKALSKLITLRDIYNDGWQPDWKGSALKYSIEYNESDIEVDFHVAWQRPLTFKSRELRDKFLENFRDLIEEAKPLL